MAAQSEGRLVEMFGAGTAAVVSPVGNIYYDGKLNPISVDASESAVSKRCVEMSFFSFSDSASILVNSLVGF
jgi:hypothetical protein